MRKMILSGLLAAALGSTAIPAMARTSVDFFVNVAPPAVYYEPVVNVAPPAVYYEPVPVPRAGFVWVPGYWDWRYNHYHWVAGHWTRHRPGYFYEPTRWHHRDGRYYRHAGGWRDSDGDGVPNRYDRAPYNPRWH